MVYQPYLIINNNSEIVLQSNRYLLKYMKSINWKCVEKEHEDSIEGLNPSIKKYLEKVSIADRKKSHCSKTSISNIAKNEK